MLNLVRSCIRLYQIVVSPLFWWMSPGLGCRYQPTCSEYFLQAVEMHGFLLGSWLGVKRIGRCHPWGGCGHDPVPRLTIAGTTKDVVCE